MLQRKRNIKKLRKHMHLQLKFMSRLTKKKKQLKQK